VGRSLAQQQCSEVGVLQGFDLDTITALTAGEEGPRRTRFRRLLLLLLLIQLCLHLLLLLLQG
jgi:hypothetical protein